VTSRELLKQLLEDGAYNFISSEVAETLVIHRVEPVLPHGDMMARVSGTAYRKGPEESLGGDRGK
jgi:hypothetical protein